MTTSTNPTSDMHDDFAKHKEGIKENLEGIAENAGRYARKVIDETHHVTDHLSADADTLVGMIRQKPIKASLIALGVGALVGMLMRRH